jgi:hypothetical protein
MKKQIPLDVSKWNCRRKCHFIKVSGVCIFLISHYNGIVINVFYKKLHSKQALGKFCA